jgi:hypothetical protein
MTNKTSKTRKSKYVTVNDRMQRGYRYELSEPVGRNFDPSFRPELTPSQMLYLGVFCGKYFTDSQAEFPSRVPSLRTCSGCAKARLISFQIACWSDDQPSKLGRSFLCCGAKWALARITAVRLRWVPHHVCTHVIRCFRSGIWVSVASLPRRPNTENRRQLQGGLPLISDMPVMSWLAFRFAITMRRRHSPPLRVITCAK